MQDRIPDFVVKNSHIKRQRFIELMMKNDELVTDVGSMLGGKEAVAEGIIDQLGGLSDAISCLYELIEKE